MRPIQYPPDVPMLYGIEMDVISVAGKICFIA